MAIRKKKSPDYHVPALEKGLDILEALAFAPVPLSHSDLARSLDRTSSELFRMLSTLEKRGFIEKDPISGKFHLTLRLYELAHTHSPVEKLLAAEVIAQAVWIRGQQGEEWQDDRPGHHRTPPHSRFALCHRGVPVELVRAPRQRRPHRPSAAPGHAAACGRPPCLC